MQRLRDEYQHLWRVERPEWTRRVADAAAEGDRSENAEYIYSKKKLREIDRRIRFLQKRMQVLTVVDRLPSDRSRVYFGARVTLQDEQGQQQCFRLVGPDEADVARGMLSIRSPLARSLLGRTEGETVEFTSASGRRQVTLLGIDYPSPA
jgi:transcription elongation factor GreB